MKSLCLFLALFLATTAFAQLPQGFSYQAVAVNTNGNAVASAPVKVRLTILDNSATGTAVYTETHNPTTNNMGLFSLTIGQGTPVTGTFQAINWAQGSKFLKVEIDITNGTNYVLMGTSQLLSVPYAMVAGTTNGYLPIITRAHLDDTVSGNFIRINGLIMPTPESISYTESGYMVGTSPNVSITNNFTYYKTGNSYTIDGSFNPSQVSNINVYFRAYAKTASGEYLYGNEVMVHIP